MKELRSLTKRGLDILIALLSLPIAIVVIVIAGIAIKVESPGPILFKQQRVGRNHQLFIIYKLRTMIDNAVNSGAGLYTEQNDPRFTTVGLWLRRYSIDELPQIFNVLKGEMSIVGPRPMLPMTIAEYADDYRVILQVRPGLTGLAQVNGRHELTRRARLELDKTYVQRPSIMSDAKIIIRTFAVVLGGNGRMEYQSEQHLER